MKLFVLAFAAGGFALAASPAEASHAASKASSAVKQDRPDSAARIAENHAVKDPETTGSVQAGPDDAAYCDRSRKRLFVEGEGWIVRKVTTCY